MKFIPLLLSVSLLFFSFSSKSQVVSKDSINLLNQRKDILELEKTVNDQKLKLAALENSIAAKQKNKEAAQNEAQKSADENAEIASKLSSNPDDRKLARQAKKAAKSAKRDAKKLRIALGDFDDLQKDIDSLKKKLSDNEQKLADMKKM